jgi:signal transduction histidine kinase
MVMKPERRPDPDRADIDLAPAKVLAVDDTPANLLAVSAILEPIGCEIVLAKSGAEALHIATHEQLAVILLDVMMPAMDGFETLTQLRQVPAARDTPVMLLTAYDLELRDIERAYALGAIDFVPKPISPEVLRAKVAAFVTVHRSAQELRRQAAALVAKDRQIAVLAHDLRSPLTTIVAAAQLLLQPRGAEAAPATVERITRAATRMSDMIRDLLDYARAGIGELPLVPASTDIGDLCRELVQEFQLADSGRHIALACAGDLWGQWDRARIFQALSNLVGNATRYGNGRATIRVWRTDGCVHLAVHNDGPPIPPELLPIIFEPFERGTQEGPGLGLGLYIVREIARGHGGDVSVTSSRENGTTFELLLPVRRSARVDAPAEARAAP